MAELIPLHYRLRVAQRRHLQRWTIGAGVAAAVSLASVTHAYLWQRQQTAVDNDLAAQVRDKSSAVVQSQRIVASRQELADKMQKIEQLMDDKTLLSLLKNISEGFSGTDCLEYIHIDARGKSLPQAPRTDKDAPAPAPAPAPAEDRYVVRISGITANSATLKDLVDRLSQRASPAMSVSLESSRRENMFDGQVMRFEIVCEKPQTDKGT
jgi:hypothetical protein